MKICIENLNSETRASNTTTQALLPLTAELNTTKVLKTSQICTDLGTTNHLKSGHGNSMDVWCCYNNYSENAFCVLDILSAAGALLSNLPALLFLVPRCHDSPQAGGASLHPHSLVAGAADRVSAALSLHQPHAGQL